MSDAQPHLARLVLRRRHDIAIGAYELDAVYSHLLEVADALPRCVHAPRRRRCGKPAVDEYPRARYFASCTASAQVDNRLRVVCTDLTHGRDTRGEPQVELVL